jgi:tRNA threonylcarbamoyladenosine biosynthesis protein TsaE
MHTARNLKDTGKFAKQAVTYFSPGDTILLYGNLGSGKTYLVRQFVRLLGLTAEVSSPSFSLINRYEGSVCVNHVDLYRIKDVHDLKNLGLDDLWDSSDISFVEWPQLIEQTICWSHFRLSIRTKEKNLKWREFSLLKMYE